MGYYTAEAVMVGFLGLPKTFQGISFPTTAQRAKDISQVILSKDDGRMIDFNHFIFTLKADLDECVKRDEKRHEKLGEQAIRDVFKLTSAFEYGVDIDTNGKTPSEVVEEIFHLLEKSII